MSLRHEVPFRTGELPVDNLGLEIDSCVRATGVERHVLLLLTPPLHASALNRFAINYLRPGPFWDIFVTLQITKYFAHNNANAPYVSYIEMKDTKQGF